MPVFFCWADFTNLTFMLTKMQNSYIINSRGRNKMLILIENFDRLTGSM